MQLCFAVIYSRGVGEISGYLLVLPHFDWEVLTAIEKARILSGIKN